MTRSNGVLIVAIAAIAAVAEPVAAQQSRGAEAADSSSDSSLYAQVSQFGGPTSVGGQLAEDATAAPTYRLQGLQDHFQPWFDWKECVAEDSGLLFNVDESILYQGVTDSTTSNTDAASGLVRVYGQWELSGRGTDNPGAMVFKGENRHRIGSGITPFTLGFEAGSATPTGTFFSDFDFGVTNLYWKQTFCDGSATLAVGQVDLTDFLDPYAMMNPLTHFINLAFSTNPTIAAPNQGLGAAAGGMLTDHIYLQGGFSDANAVPTQASFDTFFDDSEYFSYAELGVTSSQDRLYLDNIHVTLWHSDRRQAAGVPQSQGIALTAQRFIDDKWLPFVRYGYSDGNASLMQSTFSTGLGVRCENTDVAGVGLSWGVPAAGNSHQFTGEAFYRFQLTQFLAVTPDVQVIVDPASNPGTDVLAAFGIRFRLAL